MDKSRKKEVKDSVGIVRVPTGIPNLDRLIEGGFEKNSTNLLVGTSGAGKSIFAMQFLMTGMNLGEKTLYITFEEKKNEFYLNMKKFGWNLDDYEQKDLFTFLEYSPSKVKTMLEEGGGEIERVITKNKVQRVIIDSITSFTLLFENELTKREASLALFNIIKKWGCTSLLTFEEEPFKEGATHSEAIEFESDSVIILYLVMNKNKRERLIEILKMRGTDHSHNLFKFDIGTKGIAVSKEPTNSVPDFSR
jgi:circadian clock protein KaiC